MFDQLNELKVVNAIGPVAATGNVASGAIDRKGFEAVTLVTSKGAGAGVGSFELQHSDATGASSFVGVPTRETIGGTRTAAYAAAETNLSKKLGYIGGKRYVRVVFTHSANANISAHFVLGRPHRMPVS